MAEVTDKGTQIMLGLLLSQYQDSPILINYLKAFVEEMDELFVAVDDVYYGRFLEDAVGVQLDIIGDILGQARNVDLGSIQFGFVGSTNSSGFGSTTDPLVGGTFSSGSGTSAVTPLDDETYRRVLKCKGRLLNSTTSSIEDIYTAVSILMGGIPNKMIITEPMNMQVQLEMAATELRSEQELLLNYMARYFIPAGITFTILKT